MQFTKTTTICALVLLAGTAAEKPQSCSPNNPTTTPCPTGSTCKAMLGNADGAGSCVEDPAPPSPQKCSPSNPTTTPCPKDTTCTPLLGNTNGEGTCVADDNSKCFINLGQFGCKKQDGKNSHDEGCFATKKECNDNTPGHDKTVCWMNLGQFGCKVQDGKTSHNDGCFASKRECNRKTPGNKERFLHNGGTNGGWKCNPNQPFACGFFYTCKAIVGNNKHEGKCIPKWHPPTPPSNNKCNPKRANSCGRGKTCKPLLGNTNGEGTCVADDNSKCFINLGQFGCKKQDGKNSHDEGCFATKKQCNDNTPGHDKTVCWMNLGQFGCKVQDGKTSHADGCFASKRECNRKTPGGKNLRH